ncbi:MAG TPA: hypothetical protein VG328_22585 [Stellaceae bacterium]|nr:hypothetical protein [Stellaceae bacterium]
MKSEDVRRKLRALVTVIEDAGATEHEQANARRLKARLQAKLAEEGVPQGDWSDAIFRVGRAVRRAKESTAPPASIKGGTAKTAFRLGRALRQAAKKLGEPQE